MNPHPLRKQLLEVCWNSGADTNAVAQAAVDVLMVTVIAASADAGAAEKNLRRICDDMLKGIHGMYADYHDQLAAKRATRQ